MDVIFFVYGLAFMALALTVAIWPREQSRFELASFVEWLAAFAFVHGALEWMDLWRVVRGDNPALAALRPVVLLVSYLLLYEFARRLVLASEVRPTGARALALDPRIHLALVGGVLAGSLGTQDVWLHLAIWSRYLVGTSAAALAGVGFLLYCARRLQPALPEAEYAPIRHACNVAGIAFLFYAAFGGLVVPRADWFPANWLNQESFEAAFLVPVQLLRAACAVIVAGATGLVLRVFFIEGRERLRASLDERELALLELRRLARRNDLLLASVTEGIFGVDQNGNATFVNPAAVAMLGHAAEDVIGKHIHGLVHHTRTDGTPHPWEECQVRRAIEQGRSCHETQELFWRRDGTSFPVEYRAAPIHDKDRIVGAVVVFQDVTERRRADDFRQLAVSVFKHTHEGIMICDPNEKILDVNRTFSAITGYRRDEVIGRTPKMFGSGRQTPEFYRAMWQAVEMQGYWEGDIWNRRKDGEIYAERLTISAVRRKDGHVTHYIGTFSDITLLKTHQDQLELLAHYDALTRLPNRVLLSDRLAQGLAQARRNGTLLAVCYLDLDDFKPVNDRYGHDAGDELLLTVAHRLKEAVRAVDTVARLGGDEFVLILQGVANVEECERTVTRVLQALAAPMQIKGNEVRVSASIGITIFPLDDDDADALLRHADQAMYLAKQHGRNRYHLFDATQDQRARIHREALDRIRQALEAGEFRLHYQPKVDMRQGKVLGFEALIRWHDPERGLLPPAEFLPTVAGSELDPLIGRWVLHEGLRQLAQWRALGLSLALSMNVSACHLLRPGFVAELEALLDAQPGTERHAVEIEILETAALEDIDAATAVFAGCRELGVNIALDDFGTGYSSLSYFRRLPVDTLKIDQMFVASMLGNAEDLAIVESVIGLTHAFGRKLVAEGVETPELGMLLLQMGCDVGQGYGIARPMPAHEVVAWLEAFKPDPIWTTGVAKLRREDLPLLLAEVDHKHWVAQMGAWLDAEAADDAPPTLDPRACRFGRWYHGSGADRYGHYPTYGTIGALHDEVHRLGNELVALHKAGDAAAARRRYVDLTDLRDRLIAELQVLEIEISLESWQGATAAVTDRISLQ